MLFDKCITSHFYLFQAGDSIHCRRAALTIPGVESQHAGEYLFVVRSPRGMAEGAVRLNVTRGASSYSRGWTGNAPSSSNSGISSSSTSRVSGTNINSGAVPVRESTSGSNIGSAREKVENVAEEPNTPESPSKPEIAESSKAFSILMIENYSKLLLLLTVQSVAHLTMHCLA
jgi:hypothetical protein